MPCAGSVCAMQPVVPVFDNLTAALQDKRTARYRLGEDGARLELSKALGQGLTSTVITPRTETREGAFCDGGASLVDDFMWVSVLRMAPGGQGVRHCDGHCHGFTARQAHPHLYDAIIPNSSRCAF